MGKGNKKYFLFFGDIVIFYFSLWLTLIIRYQNDYRPELWFKHLLPFTLVFIFWLIILYINDFYDLRFSHNRIEVLNRLIKSMAVNASLAIIFFYLSQGRLFDIKPQRILLIDLIISSLLIYFWHRTFSFLTKSLKIDNGLIFIGFNNLVEEIIKELQNKPDLNFNIKGIIKVDQQINLPQNLKNLEINEPESINQLKEICLRTKAKSIVSTIHPRQNPALTKALFACLPLKINFFDLASFYEKITGKIPVATIEQIWFLENLSEGSKKFYEVLKRFFDLVFSLVFLIFSLPIIPLIALLIKLDSPGAVFFRQIRTGKEGNPFWAIKFRTMVDKAETNGPQWATKNDPRVTRLGRFLRKTRIDEIPQLLNVLRGEMSLIGPRPERPEFVEQLQNEIPFYKERLLIKPGLTGWAQVVGPNYGGSNLKKLEKN